MDLKELDNYLSELLQPKLFSDYCFNGLQVEGQSKITKIATGVSASLATIQAAVDLGAQALIVHHGLFWDREPLRIVGTKKQKLALLLKNDISLFGYHLPLDAHQQYGNNWGAAQLLGWQALQPFGFYKGVALGVKGEFSPMTANQFIAELEAFYGHTAHVALGGKNVVQSAALISGGAHKSVLEAAEIGVDCFVTGSFDEPIWHNAYEEKINFFALGHSNTEKIGVQLLAKHLEEKYKVYCSFIDVPNPF